NATVLQTLDSMGTATELNRSEDDLPVDGLSHVSGPGDAGEMLDARAKAEYKHRLLSLQQELIVARERDDAERASKVEAEMDFLARELARAVGLGGRDRKAASGAERARLAVTRAIKSALRKISAHNGAMERLLAQTIRTGIFCSYLPSP